MECKDATAHIADYLGGTLPDEQLEALRDHAAGCAACREELDAADETWQQLGWIPAATPDSPALRARVSMPRSTATRKAAITTEWGRSRRLAIAALAAAALLILGVAIGRQTAPLAAPAADTQMAALRQDFGEMRQMMSLSLLQQQSAAARLQGVASTGQIAEPGGEVIAALLDALMYDPNANVRLATIDALKRFMDREPVRRRALEALPRQTSPLVQIALIDFVGESAGAEPANTASADALRDLAGDAMVEDAVRMRAAEVLRQLEAQS